MRPNREPARHNRQTYFVTFQTAARIPLFRHERWALALLETLDHYKGNYSLHDFVIMPDHVHLLITPGEALERATQLIKGGYSFRAKRAFDWRKEIWQPGFSDHRIRDFADWEHHLAYIERNVLSLKKADYKFCGRNSSLTLAPRPQWLKPIVETSGNGGAEAPPLQNAPLKNKCGNNL